MAKQKTPDQVAHQAAEQVDIALVPVLTFRVRTQDDYDEGMLHLKSIKSELESLKESKSALIDPLKLSIARINDLFKAPEDRLKAADAAVRLAMKVFAEIKHEERRKAEAKLVAGKVKNVAAAVAKIEEAKTGGTATRKVLRIVDETKIPKSFYICEPDKDKIQASWRNGLPVPGTSWEDEISIVVRK